MFIFAKAIQGYARKYIYLNYYPSTSINSTALSPRKVSIKPVP